MRSFYVGTDSGSIDLSTWNKICAAAEAGLLSESQWVELKQNVPSQSPGANLELARDLASLSVDGGLLLIGIADRSGEPGEVVGVANPAGLSDRVTQVAYALVHPALHVEITVAESPDDASLGLVAIRVPASPGAPHMVDGRYWGRSAAGKTSLPDPEVRRLLEQHRLDSSDFSDQIRRAVNRNFIEPSQRTNGHACVVFRPSHYRGPGDVDLRGLLADTMTNLDPQWFPTFSSLDSSRGHPEGTDLVSQSLGATLAESLHLQVIVLDEHAQLEVISGEAVSPDPDRYRTNDRHVNTGHLVELVHCSVVLAARLAEKGLGYSGPWQAGIYIDGLRGRHSRRSLTPRGYRTQPFAQSEYQKKTTSTSRELADRPAEVVERLLRPLMRGLGHPELYFPYVDFEDIYRRHKSESL